jgi:hypothetical protein
MLGLGLPFEPVYRTGVAAFQELTADRAGFPAWPVGALHGARSSDTLEL